ncbi:hypothetical protein O6H91_19G020900 [Diphasiastrum complanatum]|uniref:Uncharacterized protein n=2 Tax=Diphasiastrum complanatum TaxID=34168 RepID=A0ACC2ATE4_DIPCM|nr:hypothetical protein O6H91_19G020900 [Diphasiastrum complanatum]KAJ7520746.1 hypothetical protein O6H91_19G020900 [Diphasiastrum complanatum]
MQSAWTEPAAQLVAEPGNTNSTVSAATQAGSGRSSYVPPHLRNKPKAVAPIDNYVSVAARSNGLGDSRDNLGSAGPADLPTTSAGAWGSRSSASTGMPSTGAWSAGRFSAGGGNKVVSGGSDGWQSNRTSSRLNGKSTWGVGTDVDPFPAEEPSTGVFDQENTGINFDAYEDIPVETSGENVPPPVSTFAEIDLGQILNENIRRCKYVKPTPVQRHAIPISLSGRDLMACAQTGSGKTAAFCFPIIAGIMRSSPPGRPRGGRKAFPLALILSPTRELSSQIHDEAKKFSFQTGIRVVVTYGGAPVHNQLRDLERGVEILVATPGRLVDLLERGRISLSAIRYLALDEADRMLDMGFEPQMRKIVEQMDMPPAGQRQTMLFSATFPREIQRLASDFLGNYIFLAVGRVGSSTDLIAQKIEYVLDADKRSMLMDLIHAQKALGTSNQHQLTLVFVETKRGADALEDWLSRMGFPATSIHGDRTQSEREQALRSFRSGQTPILVATDVAARGLDIPHVAHVVNFDLPNDIDDYVHRIGRTGRAGNTGLATALFNEKDLSLARPLAELMQEAHQEVPGWLMNFASRANFGGGGRNRRSGGGPRFGGRDFRKESGRGGGDRYSGGGYGHANAVGSSAWD